MDARRKSLILQAIRNSKSRQPSDSADRDSASEAEESISNRDVEDYQFAEDSDLSIPDSDDNPA